LTDLPCKYKSTSQCLYIHIYNEYDYRHTELLRSIHGSACRPLLGWLVRFLNNTGGCGHRYRKYPRRTYECEGLRWEQVLLLRHNDEDVHNHTLLSRKDCVSGIACSHNPPP